MIRLPSSPSGDSAAARPNPMKGPKDQASWVAPTWRPRRSGGANSAMYVQPAGTEAPTARPMTTKPMNSIGRFIVKVTSRPPRA